MKTITALFHMVEVGEYDPVFSMLYPNMDINACRERYQSLLMMFREKFGDREAKIFSAPGRTEIGGNHTDHQHGNVLAAAVELDIVCVVSPNQDNTIRVQSVGFPMDTVSLDDLSVKTEETGKAAALIRGIASRFAQLGTAPAGFDAYTTSNVLKGSGLSSSAAFEVCMGAVMNALWNAGQSPVDIAIIGQYAENRYFGKPCGLMDQLASAVGSIVQIDFADTQNPKIRSVSCNLSARGLSLCIVDTKGDHADLTDEYASIPADMKKISDYFGKKYLRQVDEAAFRAEIGTIRAKTGDRAVLRAIHFFRDNYLAVDSADALENGDISHFLQNILLSGQSSFTCLQNIYAAKSPEQQGLSLALALSDSILREKGAWRVHGGGFAGTIQAFVPDELLACYRREMDLVFGAGACHILSIRPVGVLEITAEKDGGTL